MAPGSRIGDALAMLMNPTGTGYQDLDDHSREKITAPVDALVRTIAERKGRDIDLARAMVRRELEYKIGDEVIVTDEQVLVLTNTEAERKVGEEQQPLLSEGTVSNIKDLLEAEGLTDAEVIELEVTWAEELAKLIGSVAPILMMLGMLGVYLELNSPGIGWPGIIAAICFAIFFFGHNVAGLAGKEEVIIFVVGVILIGLELHSRYRSRRDYWRRLVLGSLFFAMIQRYPGIIDDGFIPNLANMSDLNTPLLTLSTAIIGSGAGIGLIARFLPDSRGFNNRMVLQHSTDTASGYTATTEEEGLIGQTGICTTDLRPAGSAVFGEVPHDVISCGDFIEKNSEVIVTNVQGSRITVNLTSKNGDT